MCVFQHLFPERVEPPVEVCSPEGWEWVRWLILRWTPITLAVEIWRSPLKDPVSEQITHWLIQSTHNHSLCYRLYKTLKHSILLFLRNFPMSPALVISRNELTWHFFMLIEYLEWAGTVSQTLVLRWIIHTSVSISRSSVSSTDCD